MSHLSQLNPQQREAVETASGPVLILAGAGSGKTRVITYRIAHLIEEVGVAPDSVLAVTFTNKAAGEMGSRVESLVGARTLAKPLIATFHSFCVRLLRRDIETLQIGGKGYRKDFAIYDESDQQAVVKAAMRRLGIDDKQLTPRNVLSRISWAKNHMRDPQEVYLESADPKTERIAHIYEVYRQELAKSNALDFDDLLLYAVRVLKTSGETRERYNRRYRYILVDEYQDTNRPQYELMRMLAGEEHNVCAVGDEDQSIYSWRGADIRNILEFEKDFPNARIIRLEQNYRSTQNILQAASAVVSNNVHRKGKNLWTERTGGAKIGYYEAPDGENEALFAADYISKYLAKAGAEGGHDPRAAVLYRTNSQSRLLEEAMRRYQMKYHVVGGFSFYERAEIKDMISYLKAIQNPDDSVAIQRVINTPARGIGKTTMETLERIALETGISLWGAIREALDRGLLQPRALAALRGFNQLMDDARAMYLGSFQEHVEATAASEKAHSGNDDAQHAIDFSPEMFESASTDFDTESLAQEAATGGVEPPAAEGTVAPVEGFRAPGAAATTAELLKFLIDRTGYIKQLEEEDTPDSLARIDNLRELVNAALDSRDRGETLNEFLDHAALVSDADDYDENSRITLMSLHAAKGLEFPLVILVGLEEGLFPHSRTLMAPDEIEEERRLCYVGMTRAMDTLILTNARYRRRYGTDMPEASIPSRFLEEVPQELLQDLGTARRTTSRGFAEASRPSHYAYEDEDQRPQYPSAQSKPRGSFQGKSYNSIDNIAEFFASRGKKFTLPKTAETEPSGHAGFRPGQRVRHPRYGEGMVYQREGDGENAKLTVQFHKFGLKKLVEKYAQLEKA
ncbi:MAG TPA: UvrD-helicase domain-containing protein [Candidatus Angelobacter sp.]|nr:UvrD-helicase domain-containing protein [Candidatus Angelobacter sp.]